MHLPLYTAVCIFDLTNLHCYIIVYMCQGVQHSGSPNVCCSLFIFLHHEACETFAYHVVTKRRCSGYYPQCSCTNHSPTLAPYLLVSNINNGITGFMVLLQAIQFLGVSALPYLMVALWMLLCCYILWVSYKCCLRKLTRNRCLVNIKSPQHGLEIFIYHRYTNPWELQCSREYKKFLKSISMHFNCSSMQIKYQTSGHNNISFLRVMFFGELTFYVTITTTYYPLA